MTPISATTAATRQNLMDAFWQLYQKKQINQIRIHEITDLAGYNRGTFYQYFHDVYDVLDQIEQELLEHFRTFSLEVFAFPSLPAKEDLTRAFTRLYQEHGDKLSVLLSEHGDPAFLDKIKSIQHTIWKQALHLPDTLEAKYALEFLSSAILSIPAMWQKEKQNLPPQKLIDLAYPLFTQSVIPILQGLREKL